MASQSLSGSPTPDASADTTGLTTGDWTPCICSLNGEATYIGMAVCQTEPCFLRYLLQGGFCSTNEPCHRMAGSNEENSDIYSLERFLASQYWPGSNSRPHADADAILILLLRNGADPARQTNSETERIHLMKRLVDYALARAADPEILQWLLDLGAEHTYPGGRQAMQEVVQSRDPAGQWCAGILQALYL